MVKLQKVSIRIATAALLLVPAGLFAAPAPSTSVVFHDIAAGGGAGLSYSRFPPVRWQKLLDDFSDNYITLEEYNVFPWAPHGSPGVAIFDFDGDGADDIYVTNSPGHANSLFANQLKTTGQATFVDVATAAGVDLTGDDSQGVCYGDIDNDGDQDLMVVSYKGAHLFENLGDGHFQDITASSGIGALPKYTGTGCSMGDINGDGKLDILITNAFDYAEMLPFTTSSATNEPNQLLLNKGNNVFQDVSASSGLRDLAGVPAGSNMVSWSGALVDLDQDGFVDILIAEDFRGTGDPGGYIRYLHNDHTGHFTDMTAAKGLNLLGAWHAMAFGDINCDGRLDIFATNLGDYTTSTGAFPVGTFASKWLLQKADGTFSDPGAGALVSIPSGWGTTMLDYDNDGSLDIFLKGGQDFPLFYDVSDPGILLHNTGCSAHFTWDSAAYPKRAKNNRQNALGVAAGDLNNDGFPDLVTVSGLDLGPNPPLSPNFNTGLNSPFDSISFAINLTMATNDPDKYLWDGFTPINGTLEVDMSSGNSNNWAQVTLRGSDGTTTRGRANRDGFGAVMSFTTPTGKVVKPLVGGASFGSQDSLRTNFGLGTARRGILDVLWPGGIRNRLYAVRASERLTVPEIGCNYAAFGNNLVRYTACLSSELLQLGGAGVLSPAEQVRYFASALLAYGDFRTPPAP